MSDQQKTRKDFPLLQRRINGKPLIYFDNAATSQKPQKVIDAVSGFYQNHNANIHRGIHTLAEEATDIYENVRNQVAKYINANSPEEVIFVRNTTEALNLVAYSFGRPSVLKKDEIVTTIMEHHSNFLPWRELALENGAALKAIDIDNGGRLMIKTGENKNEDTKNKKGRIFNHGTKIIALTQASNVLGTVNPIKEILSSVPPYTLNAGSSPRTQSRGYPLVVVDGAQAVPHLRVNVRELGCDFYAFSGHKMFAPMGAGVLWGRREILELMPPFLFGGGMIKNVSLAGAEYAEVPAKFEAGTPSVADVAGLGAAIEYLEEIGYEEIANCELSNCELLLGELQKIPEVTIYGPKTTKDRVATISFNVRDIHPHDVAQFLNDNYGIAVRAGQHCAGPLHERLGIPASVRASLAFYNTEGEIRVFLTAIKDLIRVFK